MKKHLTVLVVGLGNFGAHVARTLTGLGHTIIALDKDEDRVQAVGRELSKAAVADISRREIYKALGADEADIAIVSLGDRIDLSALAVLHLKDLGVKEIWVKVVSDDHAELMKLIGASSTIFPEQEMAERLARSLDQPSIVEQLSLAADFGILEFILPDALAGQTLIDLDLRRKYGVNVIAVHDAGRGESSLNPDPTQPLARGDILYILGLLKDLERFQDSFK
jgi:trk system potassium uptake protein TrkA